MLQLFGVGVKAFLLGLTFMLTDVAAKSRGQKSSKIVGLTRYLSRASRCDRKFIFLFFIFNLLLMLWR